MSILPTADVSFAVEAHDAHLAEGIRTWGRSSLPQAGRSTDADQLSALAGCISMLWITVPRDVGQGAARCAGWISAVLVERGPCRRRPAHGGQDIAALAVSLLQQGDIGAAVRGRTQAQDRGAYHLVPLEVDDAVLALIAAAAVATVMRPYAVAARVLLEHLGEALAPAWPLSCRRSGYLNHLPSGRCSGLKRFNHGSLSSCTPYLEELDGLESSRQLHHGLFPVLGTAWAGRLPTRFALPGTIMVLTLATFTSKIFLHRLRSDFPQRRSHLEHIFLSCAPAWSAR